MKDEREQKNSNSFLVPVALSIKHKASLTNVRQNMNPDNSFSGTYFTYFTLSIRKIIFAKIKFIFSFRGRTTGGLILKATGTTKPQF